MIYIHYNIYYNIYAETLILQHIYIYKYFNRKDIIILIKKVKIFHK
jgi:hypothetical protein